MKKRIIGLLLAAVMLLSLLPVASAAEIVDSGTCGENLTWTLDANGLLTISGTGPMENYYAGEGYPGVTPFYGNKEIKAALIEDGVTSIGDWALSFCPSLTSVTIGKGVKSIGTLAFFACISLTSVDIPDNVTSIGQNAFQSCDSLMHVTLPSNLTVIDGLFHSCISLTSVTIPDSVTRIGLNAFYGCDSLTNIKIPNNVTSIDELAFCSCDNLTSVTIGDGVTSIKDHAFENSYALTNVYFFGDAPEMGENVFDQAVSNRMTYEALENLTLYYIEGKAGWTSPQWNGYPTATWQPRAEDIFDDVPANAWYLEAVNYAVDHSLMNGLGDGKFNPDGTMTRAMLVTVLWRYAGSPTGYENIFTDLTQDWYIDAVAWAAANSIVNGVGNGKFDPDGSITREQMATILFRYSNSQGLDTAARDDLSAFPDASKVTDWALEAMQWCVAEKLISGTDNGGVITLNPLGTATRAEVATILMRYIENLSNT